MYVPHRAVCKLSPIVVESKDLSHFEMMLSPKQPASPSARHPSHSCQRRLAPARTQLAFEVVWQSLVRCIAGTQPQAPHRLSTLVASPSLFSTWVQKRNCHSNHTTFRLGFGNY